MVAMHRVFTYSEPRQSTKLSVGGYDWTIDGPRQHAVVDKSSAE